MEKKVKRKIRNFKASSGAFGKKLITKVRNAVLKVISRNLSVGHRITRILKVLKLPASTYYNYLKSQRLLCPEIGYVNSDK